MVNLTLRRIFGYLLALGMGCACYWSIRFAYADHLAQTDSVEGLQAALRVAPGNVSYWLQWADLREARGQSGESGIERAAQTDPSNATVWMRAGLAAERKGDFARAEQDLLRAARESRQYDPRWTLANYYFRRGDMEHFWPWMKSALEWSHGDRSLLFELCWQAQPDGRMILERAIPDSAVVLRDYLLFLLNNHHSEAALPVAEKLSENASVSDRDDLLAYANNMLDRRQWSAALSTWNALCLRKVVQYAPLDPSAGRLLTNGALRANPMDSGFDWHLPRISGVASMYNETPPSLRFDFSGNQPENCDLVYQFVPVIPQGRYALRFGYRTEGNEPQTGLQWKVTDAETYKELPLPPQGLASDTWEKGGLAFAVPPGMHMAKVTLAYRRQPGTVRIEGTAWLRDVSLEALP